MVKELTALKKMMCPPGEGVYTVHTAKERRLELQEKIYQTKNDSKVRTLWEKSLKNIPSTSLAVIGIPSDNGGGIQRGANWGPLSVRLAMMEEDTPKFLDVGDIRVIPHLLHDKYLKPNLISECRKALYGSNKTLLPVSPLSITEKSIQDLHKINPKIKVFAIGGDHSVSYPLVKAYLEAKKKQKIKVGLLHFDAHTDLMQKRLGVDLCFGSWTYHISKLMKTPSHIVQVGIRSSGKPKAHWEKTVGIKQWWSKEIQKSGIESITEKTIAHFKKLGIEELYISFDIDALDEKFASATGTPEPDGMKPYECVSMIRKIASEFKVTGADLVEVAPFVLPPNASVQDQKQTLTTAAIIGRVLLEAMDG
jgi:agmatinase